MRKISKKKTRAVLCALTLLFPVLTVASAPPAAASGGSAYAPPGGAWGPWGPGTYMIGTGSTARVVYSWYVPWWSSAGSVCVEVRGYNSSRQATTYSGGCGKRGEVIVPWGAVASTKMLRARSISALWTGVPVYY